MDDAIILIKKKVTGHDENGNEILSVTRRELMCRVYGVTRAEFYSAAAVGMRPEITVRLSDFEDYEGEHLAEFNGELYTIIRTYRDAGSYHRGGGLAPNELELILQRKIGDDADE